MPVHGVDLVIPGIDPRGSQGGHHPGGQFGREKGVGVRDDIEQLRGDAPELAGDVVAIDGTAKGGILLALSRKFALPIHMIGVGEGIDDLQDFDADGFAAALVGEVGK